MKKTLHFINAIVLAFALTFSASAQLADGSIAPDFTGVDINGNSHNLYDLLDQGITVIMDVSATWCPPCWTYHQTGALEDVWFTHGPDGDNTAMVLFIEGDATTTLADLNGTGTNTAGDWVSISDFPIIDDASIGDLFETTYFPTIFKICPDRILTEIGTMPAAQITAEIGTCGPAGTTNNAASWLYSGDVVSCGDIVPAFSFHNLGSTMLTEAEMELLVDGIVVETITWSGTPLTPLTTGNVTFSNVTLTGNSEVTLNITTVNQQTDDYTADNMASIDVAGPTPASSSALNLTVVTDNWGSETYWELREESGTIIQTGGNTTLTIAAAGTGGTPATGGYASASTNNETLNLPNEGCYYFHIIDTYGDGICCNEGNGAFQITDASGNIIGQGGEYDAEQILAITFEAAPPLAGFSQVVADLVVLFTDNSTDATSWLWSFGDGTTSTDQNPGTHAYAEPGTYTVTLTVTNAGGIDSYTTEITVGVVGIEDAENGVISILPNPAFDFVQINLGEFNLDVIAISLLNINGQLVKTLNNVTTGENISLDLTDVVEGMYYINVVTKEGNITKRLKVTK